MVSLNYLPLAVVAVIVGTLVLSLVNGSVGRRMTRLALATFGRYVDSRGTHRERERTLRGAYLEEPYRVYASKTLLYSTIAAIVGSVLGVYLASGLLILIPALTTTVLIPLFPLPPEIIVMLRSLPNLSFVELFGLLLASSATVGVLSWVTVFELRWWIPDLQANARRRRIELSMPRMIAFMYALSRGGIELPRVLQILRRHQRIYGESAREMAIAGKAIEVFGTDNVSAIHHVSRRTPSDQFRIFTENLASVLQSGRSIPQFLSEQYEQYQQEAEIQQELFLDRLGAIAEAYVALFVVGPLFLVTVLLIFGLISGGTQLAMVAIIYVFTPLLNLGFIYYLDFATQPLNVMKPDRSSEEVGDTSRLTVGASSTSQAMTALADGGTGIVLSAREWANVERLVVYDKFQAVRSVLGNPIRNVLSKPTTIFYLTVPVAVLWVTISVVFLTARDGLAIAALDDYLVQSVLIIVAPYALVRRLHTGRLRAVERLVPDLFNRLASLNESGIEIVNAFREIRRGDLGLLSPELDRIWTDIEYGMDVERALNRFERRTRAPSVSRAVTLITNGMRASGNIGPVLRIAADESRRLHSLKRERESEMYIYLIIIYLAFIVFLAIVFVLVKTFIPAIPSKEALEGSGLVGVAAGITREQAAVLTMLLFHASLIQATFAGMVAGQMSRGSIRDGAIHVAILVVLAYVTFSVVI